MHILSGRFSIHFVRRQIFKIKFFKTKLRLIFFLTCPEGGGPDPPLHILPFEFCNIFFSIRLESIQKKKLKKKKGRKKSSTLHEKDGNFFYGGELNLTRSFKSEYPPSTCSLAGLWPSLERLDHDYDLFSYFNGINFMEKRLLDVVSYQALGLSPWTEHAFVENVGPKGLSKAFHPLL